MPKKTTRRAKKPLNKAEAIRNYKRDHPDSKPKEISEVLNKKGYKTNPQYVSMILSSERRKKGTAKTRQPSATVISGNEQISVDDLLVAKAFVNQIGSVSAARAAVDAFARISESK